MWHALLLIPPRLVWLSQDLVQQPLKYTPAERDSLGRWALLMLVLIFILLLTVIGMLWVVLVRRRIGRTGTPRAEPSLRADAWAEAGRRMPVPSSLDEDDSTERAAGGAALRADLNASPDPRQVTPNVFSGRRPVALVTGGAQRVGRAICLELARAGCDILLTYNSSEAQAESLVAELKSVGAHGVSHRVNFLDLDAVEVFADSLRKSLPRLDVLVHNASVYAATPLRDLATHEAIQQLSINALAPLILTSRLSILLRQSRLPGGGAIVALADIHAMGRPRRGFIAYSMSKAALVELVYAAARELAPHVRVNGVAPGVVAWPADGADSTQAEQEAYLKRVPLGRSGVPEDAAKAVRWLAMEANYTTGQILRVDGGRWIT